MSAGAKLVEARRAGHRLERDHVLQAFELAAYLGDLRGLRGVRDEHGLRFRVGEDVAHLRGRERRIDRHIRAAEREHGHVGERPLRAVLGQDRDVIALVDAERRETHRDLLDRRAQLVGADRAPRAVALVAEALRPFEAIDGSIEELAERLDGHSAERRRGARPE